MKGLGGIFLFVIFLVLISLRQLISLYVDWLWFEEVGYTQVFTISLFFKTVLAVLGGSIFALLIYANVRIAARLVRGIRFLDQENFLDLPRPELIDPLVQRLLLPAALVLGLFAAPQAASHWESFLLLLNPTSFGLEDPLYNRDLGFFVFQLPALRTLYNWLMTALALSLALTAVIYVLYRGLQYSPRGIFLAPRARFHLLILIAALLAVKAAGYVLDSYDLLYASGGAAFGAGYTDVYVSLPALRILTVAALIAAALSAVQITRPGFAYLLVGIAGLVLVHVIGLSAAPAMVQRFRVVPNEVDSERPFIEHNIKFTRTAYGLDKIENEDFPADETLNAADLQRNDATIKNIRLWEHQPLLATYAQLQEIRTYYKFVDVDNDRYNIDGTYRQIMLSARELSHQHLPSRIWINEHLTYTHGYGVVFGPVNQVTPEGLPEFFIKDIPPVSDGSLKVTRPEIYYGELANDYVFVKSGARELDYPAGDQNIYTQYSGSGGVSIGSLWRKLIFSAHFATLRIVLSEDIVQESRILYQRQIQERVKKVLPFVTFDRDAYMVIAQGGRLFWMIDGYTTSDRFPYSAPIRRRGTNYIRNSVKAVVDAYNGTVDFYMSDPEDPIVQSYQKIFPQLFKPLEKMPEDLRAHIRYPEDLFTIQVSNVRNLSHAGSAGFLQQRGFVKHPAADRKWHRAGNGALLYHHAPTGRDQRGVRSASALHAEQPGQYAGMAGGAQRSTALWEAHSPRFSQGETGLWPETDRRSYRTRRFYLATIESVGTEGTGDPGKLTGHPYRKVPALCPTSISGRRKGLFTGVKASYCRLWQPNRDGRDPRSIPATRVWRKGKRRAVADAGER